MGAAAAAPPARPHRSDALSTTVLTRLSYDEALAASGDDEFVRWQVSPLQSPAGWHVGDAVAFMRRRPDRQQVLTVVGPPSDAAALVRTMMARTGSLRTTLPFGTLELLGDDVTIGEGADWEWMITDTPPSVGQGAGWLADGDGPEISALLAAASPRHSADPGDDDVVAWMGVRSADGALVACAAHTEAVRGVPHLASIATHPSVRGQGLGALVTGVLVRRLLEGAPVVTLGMYSDNAVARRMYHSLGFRCRHFFSSRLLSPC